MTDPAPQPANLNADAAADYLGGTPITGKTLMALARKQQIGHIKIGRATVFPVAALDRYIADHTVQPVENPWGLTDAALRNLRDGRAGRRRLGG